MLGPAKLREDVARPMISKSKDSRYYFISNKSEARIILSKSIWAFFIMLFSFIAALASPVVAISVDTGIDPREVFVRYPEWVVFSGWSFAVVGLFYLSMLYNGLIRVRNRLTHALGLIEIQLKRRYDLIPRLLECVKGISEYERGVGTCCLSVDGTSGTKHGVGEIAEEMNREWGWSGDCLLCLKIPEFECGRTASFLKELVDTEDRIALARPFTTTASLFFGIVVAFPDLLVAKWFRFKAGKNLNLLPEPEMNQALQFLFE